MASRPLTHPSHSLAGRPHQGPGSLLKLVGAALGGLAAGATAAHLLYTRGHRIGLDLRTERPAPPETPDPTPLDLDFREPGRGRLAERPHQIPLKGWTDILWRTGVAYFGDRVGFVSGGVTFFSCCPCSRRWPPS